MRWYQIRSSLAKLKPVTNMAKPPTGNCIIFITGQRVNEFTPMLVMYSVWSTTILCICVYSLMMCQILFTMYLSVNHTSTARPAKTMVTTGHTITFPSLFPVVVGDCVGPITVILILERTSIGRPLTTHDHLTTDKLNVPLLHHPQNDPSHPLRIQ